MTKYEPELGQMVFGQPYKEFEVGPYVKAALAMIDREMERVWFNTHGHNDPYSSPFGNHGSQYEECSEFKVHSYDWGDEEQPWNFKWGDIEISWYKYLGRGMSANQMITPDMGATMLRCCLAALAELEKREIADKPR